MPTSPNGVRLKRIRRLLKGISEVFREAIVSDAVWSYTMAMRAEDDILGLFSVEVAQVSARFGARLAAHIVVAA